MESKNKSEIWEKKVTGKCYESVGKKNPYKINKLFIIWIKFSNTYCHYDKKNY